MRLFGHKPKVSFKQLCFVSYAGMIRGAIAFGLVLRLGNLITNPVKLQVITTSAITLVVGTTLIFGSTMAPVQKWLLPKLTEEELIKQMIHVEDEDL